jgi:hypothetical protein
MSYFPHAFKKVFIGDTFVTSGKTEDLAPGEFGFFNPETWEAVAEGDALTSVNPNVVLAVGSHRTRDKIGSHGGYKESLKSQVITSYHVHRIWKVEGRGAQQQVVYVGWDGDDGATPAFVCGKNYTLRIDVKGSPALRLLGRNMYHNFDYFTGCCADEDAPTNVDPTVVLLGFAAQINNDPIFSQFVTADVVTTGDTVVNPDTYTALTDAGDIGDAVGALRLTVTYEDTTFDDCSFSPMDHFELEPVLVTSAQLVDESGDPCPAFTQVGFTEIQAPLVASGTGEKILREFIMSNSYRQEFYYPDPRRREAEGANSVLTTVDRTALYDTYYILHSVPRKSNPTGVYDDDLYLLQLNVPDDADTSDLDAWLFSYLDSANRGLDLAFLNQSS